MLIKRLNVLLLAAVVSACAGTKKSTDPHEVTPTLLSRPDDNLFQLRFPEQEKVQFLGKPRTDQKAASSATIMYPGGAGLAGFFAGVATHGVIASSVNESKKKARQKIANKVLEPFQPSISQITFTELYPRLLKPGTGLQKSILLQPYTAQHATNTWVVESNPVYYMTQKNDLILHNEIKIYASDDDDYHIFNTPVAVLYNGPPLKPADNGEVFNSIVKKLFAESMSLALASFRSETSVAENNRMTTIRYMENGEKKVERGRVLFSSCKKVVFETLRKWIKSVPTFKRNSESC